MTNKTSTTQEMEQFFMTLDYSRPACSMKDIIEYCQINNRGLNSLILQLKAILVTEELRYDFMMRVPSDPTGSEVFNLLHKIRKEQLEVNPMSDELFLDMYFINPVQALRQYFKEHIIPFQVERMRKWEVTVEQLINLKKNDKYIQFEIAMAIL
ncbi:hypothetical protein [Paenibacillus illinoisensis]|nr:hypothetical protein [Paenibacillus illinoisensis]